MGSLPCPPHRLRLEDQGPQDQRAPQAPLDQPAPQGPQDPPGVMEREVFLAGPVQRERWETGGRQEGQGKWACLENPG